MKTIRASVLTTLGYLISHESHHRGSVLLVLKQCGQALPREARDELWGSWSRR